MVDLENTVGNVENAGYQHFSFPTMFSKAVFSGALKVWLVWERVDSLPDHPKFEGP